MPSEYTIIPLGLLVEGGRVVASTCESVATFGVGERVGLTVTERGVLVIDTRSHVGIPLTTGRDLPVAPEEGGATWAPPSRREKRQEGKIRRALAMTLRLREELRLLHRDLDELDTEIERVAARGKALRTTARRRAGSILEEIEAELGKALGVSK